MQRQPTQRIILEDFHKSKYVQTDGEYEPNYVITEYAQEVTRVKIIATVADTPRMFDESGFSVMLLDDGTETVSCFAFRELASSLDGLKKGDIVQIVAKVGEWEGEKRLNLETISRMNDPNWLIYHRATAYKARQKAIDDFEAAKKILESINDVREAKQKAKENGIDPNIIVSISELEESSESKSAEGEIKVEDNQVEEVKKALEDNDGSQGVSLATIKEKLPDIGEEHIKSILKELLTTGDVFEPKVGYFSLVLY